VYFPDKVDYYAGKNITEIGLSSGKFSTYMMLGIPAVTSENITYKELNEKYDFGYTVSIADEIPEALRNIKRDLNKKSAGSRKLYEEVLDPVSRIDELVRNIEEFYN
jgi:hypothetical protein